MKKAIRNALRQFRTELKVVIHQEDLNEIDCAVLDYLLSRKLIAWIESYQDMSGDQQYCITPKGFNWNPDKECVEMGYDIDQEEN
jgi:hypothetical protein